MATLPSEEDLEYLWRPKRTLHDWGETNYNIVRNWTPHNKKLAPPNSSPKLTKKTKASVTKVSTTKKPSTSTKLRSAQLSTAELSTSYRLRRNTRKQQSTASSESNWYVPDDPTANRRSTNFGSLKQNRHNRGRQLNNEISKSEQIHSDDSMSSSESPNGAHFSLNHMSDTSNQPLLSPDSKDTHAHVASQDKGSYSGGGGGMSEGEEQSAPVQRPDNEDRDSDVSDGREGCEGHEGGEGGMATEEETDPMSCEDMDTDALLPPSSKKSTDLNRQQVSSRAKNRKSTTGRGKRPASKPGRSIRKKLAKETSGDDNEPVIKVMLWQSEGTTQTAKEPSELDPCPTLHDRIVKEAITELGNEVVQNSLVSCWDGMQKQNLSTIEDLCNVTALEERLKEEKIKHNQLQKEMLKSLRRSNGEYHEVLMKAKGDKRRRVKKTKHSHLQKEMHDVLQGLRRSNGEYHEALAQAKGDKQRRETQDVERQIAAVGLLLQSSLSS